MLESLPAAVMTTQINSSQPSPITAKINKVSNVTSRVSPWFRQIAYPLASYVILPFYFGSIEITGRENLPREGPVILAPTHRSRWDSFMIPHAAGYPVTGRDLRFMVSANEMLGLQGWFIRRMGGFPLDTEHPGISSIRHAIELLLAGEVLVLFPEGNIFRQERVESLKPGLARIALQAESNKPDLGIKIVPMSIRYSQAIPHWGCDVDIRIGTPLQVADYRTEPLKRSALRLTEDLEKAIEILS